MTSKCVQRDRILDYCEKFGSITDLEAFQNLGIRRLAARIYDLKHCGYKITSVYETHTDRLGIKGRHTRYWIEKPAISWQGQTEGGEAK